MIKCRKCKGIISYSFAEIVCAERINPKSVTTESAKNKMCKECFDKRITKQVNEEGMKMKLTRKQYDSMVNCYPAFMRKEYLTLSRQWFVDGVLLGGNYKTICELAELLNTVEY